MRRGVFKHVLAVILCMALAALLILLLVKNNDQEKSKTEHLSALENEANERRSRIAEIRKDLAARKKQLESTGGEGMMLVGYLPVDDNLDSIAEQADAYGFEPVILVNVSTKNAADIYAAASERGWSIVLTSRTLNDEVFEAIRQFRSTTAKQADTFLIRSADDNQENLEKLAAEGFTCCIRYADADEVESLPDMTYLEYSFLQTSKFSIEKRLDELESSVTPLLFAFDMSTIDSDAIATDVAMMAERVNGGQLSWFTLSAARTASESSADELRERQEEYNKYAAEKQKEIDKLQKEIDDIYSGWDGD